MTRRSALKPDVNKELAPSPGARRAVLVTLAPSTGTWTPFPVPVNFCRPGWAARLRLLCTAFGGSRDPAGLDQGDAVQSHRCPVASVSRHQHVARSGSLRSRRSPHGDLVETDSDC